MGGRRGGTGEIETDDVGAENGATGERNQHPQGHTLFMQFLLYDFCDILVSDVHTAASADNIVMVHVA